MDTYSFLRELADSWALLTLTLIFLGIVLWALRPGSNAVHTDIANSIFRNEQQPAGSDQDTRPAKEA
jgi:cytochrome c oxidase cbb3-type subunit 4